MNSSSDGAERMVSMRRFMRVSLQELLHTQDSGRASRRGRSRRQGRGLSFPIAVVAARGPRPTPRASTADPPVSTELWTHNSDPRPPPDDAGDADDLPDPTLDTRT